MLTGVYSVNGRESLHLTVDGQHHIEQTLLFKKYTMKNIFLFVFSICCLTATAQNNYTIDTIPIISVTGTSTLHDWTVQAGVVTDYPMDLSLEIKDGATIDSFSFAVPVAKLDGGRGPSMNAKIQKAFVAETNPTISYQQKGAATINAAEASTIITSSGTVSMAGVEKEIEVVLSVEEEEGALILKGSKDLKMTDFGMTPPSAMFGQIETRDDITVHFEFVYRK